VKNKLPAVVALLCIFVYLGAVLFAAYRIYINVTEQQRMAGQELDKLQSLVVYSGESFFSEPFRDQLQKTLEGCKALQGIIITGDPNINLPFSNPNGSSIQWENGPRFVTRLGYASLDPRQVTIPGLRNVTNVVIHSMSQAVNYGYLADVLKQTLLVILGGLIVSFFTMIITVLNSRGKEAADPFAEQTASKTSAAKKVSVTKKTAAAEETFDDYDNPVNFDSSSGFDSSSDYDASSGFDAAENDFSAASSEMPDVFSDDLNTMPTMDELPDVDDLDMPGMDDMSGTDDMDDMPDIPDMDYLSDTDGQETVPEYTVMDDGLDLPDFNDFSASPEEGQTDAETGTDDGFHLDDFIDESELNLPEIAVMNDLGDMDDLGEAESVEQLDDDEAPAFADDFSPPEESSPPSPGTPSGLYSPRSNIGWEAYTPDRLASELHRCAASEQDLVLMLMECAADVNCDGKLYRKIADEAVDLFNLHDLTFEYGNRGITVILPNESLEQGIIKAEEFHARIFKTCYDSFHATNDFLIGISSRSGRLVEAGKLLQEAATALEKAGEEAGSPIVAFKSDPEKYREYIRRRI